MEHPCRTVRAMPDPNHPRSSPPCLCRDCARVTTLRFRCRPEPCRTPHSGTPHSGTPHSGTRHSGTTHSGTRHSGPGYLGDDPTLLRGRPLRRAAVAVLLRTARPCSPAEVLQAIESWGYAVASTRPGKAVADALAYEVDRGWLRRVGRGLYQVDRLSQGSRYRILADFR
jgi:hypothetical protein